MRGCSAVLTRISTRCAISPATSATDWLSVISSGTISTPGYCAQRGLAGKRLPRIGDADENDRRARRRHRARHRLTGGVAAVGDQHAAELRVAGQFPQLHVVLLMLRRAVRHRQRDGIAALVQTQGHADAVALGARRRADGQRTMGRNPAQPCRCATACARGNTRRCWCGSSFPPATPRSAARPGTARERTGIAGRRRAADTARSRNRRRPAARNAPRRRPRSGRARCGCAHPAAVTARASSSADLCAADGSAGRSCAGQQDSGAGQSAIVVDHAEAGDQADASVRARWSRRLRRSVGGSPRPARDSRRPRPPGPTDNWPPEVLCGKSPSVVRLCARTKAGASPLAQKPRSSICIITITG